MSNGFWMKIIHKLLGNTAVDSSPRVHIKISKAGNKYLFMKILHLTEKNVNKHIFFFFFFKKRTERPPKHSLYMHRGLCSFSVTNYSPSLLNTFFKNISLIHKFSKNIKTE